MRGSAFAEFFKCGLGKETRSKCAEIPQWTLIWVFWGENWARKRVTAHL